MNQIDLICDGLLEINWEGPFVLFVPFKLMKEYLAELFNEEDEDFIYCIRSEMKHCQSVPGFIKVRADVLNYRGIEFAFVDPERIQNVKKNALHNS